MPESLIERYLTDMGEVRGTRSNVPETSFYPAMERLLSDIGKSLSPKVRCVINLANRGAGLHPFRDDRRRTPPFAAIFP